MSGISARDLRPEERLARDERSDRAEREAHTRRRYPCTDPHRTGCQNTAGQKHRACIDCNRKGERSHTFTRRQEL